MAEGDVTRTDLSDLVDGRIKELGLSFRSLAAICIDPEAKEGAGGPLWTRSTLDRLSKGLPITPPDFPQLRALASALQLPRGLVQEAAGSQFLGIDTIWSEDGKVRALVHEFREMEPDDQEKVLVLMQTWRKMKRP
ncbi:hypothetical protein [Streptomyces sp. NBC_00035]|uniref:hypothetical protein n=1 Tax=Streptomyces sp. NBC_00035 TaxID=2903614 RepID=UPI003247AE68